MKSSEILKLARDRYLWNGQATPRWYSKHEPYICWALGRVSRYDFPEAGPKVRVLRDEIHERLRGHSTLEGWLNQCRRIRICDMENDKPRMQATRHAWMTALIEEYAAKGD
jgi:hypothetical protein